MVIICVFYLEIIYHYFYHKIFPYLVTIKYVTIKSGPQYIPKKIIRYQKNDFIVSFVTSNSINSNITINLEYDLYNEKK